MSQRVDFYLLGSEGRPGLLQNACRIANKAYQQGMRVFIQVDEVEEAKSLDQLLWQLSPVSFVPHAIAAAGVDAPVLIGIDAGAVDHGEMLISLTRDVPVSAGRYQRVADLIAADDDSKQSGRNRFKHYRANGIEPGTHQLNT